MVAFAPVLDKDHNVVEVNVVELETKPEEVAKRVGITLEALVKQYPTVAASLLKAKGKPQPFYPIRN